MTIPDEVKHLLKFAGKRLRSNTAKDRAPPNPCITRREAIVIGNFIDELLKIKGKVS